MLARIVVVHLVVVPREQPGAGSVRGLQIRVGLVQGVARAVVVQRLHPAAIGVSHRIGGAGVFVDVIAQKQHQIELLPRHVAVRAVKPVLPALAGGVGQAQFARARIWRGRRARAPNAAGEITSMKSVKVPAVSGQALHFDVHRMRQLRHRHGLPLLHNLLELILVGDFPAHVHRVIAQGRKQTLRQQTRPQHHAIRHRCAAGNTQCEGVAADARLAAGRARQPQGGTAGGKPLQEIAPRAGVGQSGVGLKIGQAHKLTGTISLLRGTRAQKLELRQLELR